MEAGVELRTSAVDAVIDQSLLAVSQGSVVRFSGRSGEAPPKTTSRWLRCFGSTLYSPNCLFDFSPESGLSEPPNTEVVCRDTVGCTTSGQHPRVLLSAADWLQSRVRDQIAWTAVDSTFLGFRRLLDLGASSSFRVDDADGWRLFWRQRVGAQEFVEEPWPGNIPDVGLVSALSFDRDLLPVAVRQLGGRGELPGVSADWLRMPDTMHPERLAAMAGRAPPPAPIAWETGSGGPLTIDIRKQDLGQALSQNDWPSGAVVEAVGYGVCQTSPVSISGKKLKLIFRQAEGGPLRVMPKESARAAHAVFEVRDGVLELEGCHYQQRDVRPRHSSWMVHGVNSALIFRDCKLLGPDEATEPYEGLVRFEAAPDAPAGAAYLQFSNCQLLGAGTLVRCEAGAGRVYVRNSLLAGQQTAIDVQLKARGQTLPFSMDISSSTLTAGREIFRVQPASVTGTVATPSQWYVEQSVLGAPGPWKPIPGVRPVVLRGAAPLLEQRQLAWWGRNNGLAKDVGALLEVDGVEPPRTVTTVDEWDAEWGTGHEINLLTGGDGVVLARQVPTRIDQAAPEHFELHPACKGAVWGGGRPIGIDIARLETAGPQAAEPPPTTQQGTPKAPTGQPKRPKF